MALVNQNVCTALAQSVQNQIIDSCTRLASEQRTLKWQLWWAGRHQSGHAAADRCRCGACRLSRKAAEQVQVKVTDVKGGVQSHANAVPGRQVVHGVCEDGLQASRGVTGYECISHLKRTRACEGSEDIFSFGWHVAVAAHFFLLYTTAAHLQCTALMHPASACVAPC